MGVAKDGDELIHRRTHPSPTPGCFACKVSSLSYATGVTRTLAEKSRMYGLDQYAKTRKEGSQPRGTKPEFVEKAKRESDRLGRAYRADDLANTYYPDIAKALTDKVPVSANDE